MSTEQQPQEQEQIQKPIEDQVKKYNPFLESVNEKPYSKVSVGVTPDQLANAIPEPGYNTQMIDTNYDPYSNLNGEGFNSNTQKSSQPFNPGMNDLSDSDKKMGADHLANLIIDGYESLHPFANKALQISPKRLQKLEREGVIDLSIPIPFQAGETITAGNLINEFNEQNKEALTVSKQWKKEVKPVLTRVLEKKGAGLTDEQMLIYLFGKDIAVKSILAFQIRGAMNDLINVMKDATEAYRSGAVSPTPPPPPSQPQATQTQQFTQQEYQEPNYNAEDFNFQTNETVMRSTVQQMNVPETGKERLKAQLVKEQQWRKSGVIKDSADQSAYEKAMAERKGKKRNKKTKDYIDEVKMDEDEIAEAIILNETVNQPRKQKDPLEGLD